MAVESWLRMSEHFEFARQCLELAREEPARALVRLWNALWDHGPMQTAFERTRLKKEFPQALLALEENSPAPSVHPAAAACAVDEFLHRESMGAGGEGLRWVRDEGPEGFLHTVVPRRSSRASHLDGQPSKPGHWFRHHRVVTGRIRGIDVTVRPVIDAVWNVLAKSSELRFAAGGFTDGILPDWHHPPYRTDKLLDPSGRWTSLEGLVESLSSVGMDLLVLPELTVDADVLRPLREWLRGRKAHGFKLVAAGSYHEPGPPRSNIGRLIDHLGRVLVEHRKLCPMRVGPDSSPIDEDIEGGSELVLLWTPIGLAGLAICLDFCDEPSSPAAEVWYRTGADLLLVPSMGSETTNHAHERRAIELARQHSTVTIVASQHPEENRACGLFWQPGGGHARSEPVVFGTLRRP